MIRRLVRFLFRSSPSSSGRVPPYRPRPGEQMVILSPGRRLDDPDEAEALGLAADAKRMRRQERRPEGWFPPGFIDRINQGRRP